MKYSLSLISVIFGNIAFAQGWFGGIETGYNTNLLGTKSEFYHAGLESYTTRKMPDNYSLGLTYSLKLGYILKEKISVGMKVSYLDGSTIETNSGPNGFFASSKGTITINGLGVQPFAQYNIWQKKQLCLVIEAAPKFMFPELQVQSLSEFDPSQVSAGYLEYIAKTSGGISFGADLSVSAIYKFYKKWSVHLGLNYNYNYWRPAKLSVTYKNYDSNMTLTSQSDENYTFTSLEDSDYNYSTNVGSKRPYDCYYFQNLGVHLGLSCNF